MCQKHETPLHPSFVPYRLAASYIREQLQSSTTEAQLPVLGIICGSGLSGLSSALTNTTMIPYESIPGFPKKCTVMGHKGEIVFGLLSGVPCVCFRGRFHWYEGHPMNTVVLPVHVMRSLGVKVLIVTNAAGGLNGKFNVGDIVNIMDHFALPMLGGMNPLVGPNDDELGPRFPPTSNAYDSNFQNLVLEASSNLGLSDFVRTNGMYCFVSGPQYESKAECKFLLQAGGDAVGMSTVPEIVAAHHCGIKIMCLSLITNKVVMPYDGDDDGEKSNHASHEEVLDAVNKRSEQVQGLVKEIARLLEHDGVLKGLPDLPPINLDVGRVMISQESSISGNDVSIVPNEKKTRAASFCPFHIMKGILNAPAHCVVIGGAMITIGALFGATMGRRK
mmetsp:Transcript_61532/g.91489  ORF Transcript_61532/g.91489 Transcript_61532/m.91489 type:complete len:390 (+) Transcript_61532:139-1308(+)